MRTRGGGHRQRLAIARRLGDRYSQGATLNNLGEVACAQGRHQDAIAHHRQGSTISHEVGDRYSEAINLLGLGHAVAAAHGRPAALHHWRDAHAILAGLRAPEAEEVRVLLDDPAG